MGGRESKVLGKAEDLSWASSAVTAADFVFRPPVSSLSSSPANFWIAFLRGAE